MQSTKLQPEFIDYINSLDITSKSKANYRQYVRWFEKYGNGALDIVTLRDPAKVEAFIDNLERHFDVDSDKIRRLPFYARKPDAKTILHHYLNFLQFGKIEQKLEGAGEFDDSNEQDAKEKVLRSIVLRRGQPKFRANLLRAYAGKCAIIGTSVADILEAAHIAPYNGPSTNRVSNGLLLRSDIHSLFDLGLLSIDPNNLRIYCSKEIRREPMYAELNEKPLRVPEKQSRNQIWTPCEPILKNDFFRRFSILHCHILR